MKIKHIQIESETKGPIIGGEEYVNDNSDVHVEFENGEKYVATFFTYRNIEWLKQKNLKTGECLGGKYFWSSDMIMVERTDRQTIELVINELLTNEEFKSIFSRTNIQKTIWVFNGARSQHSGGLFEDLEEAEKWIEQNKLTGMLTEYPINTGVFDWAIENNLVNMKAEKIEQKKNDSMFIGGFTTASMHHYHYENGIKE